ncbi:Uncharacterised protein [Metamycoplasma cloacale]|uniref:Uncharacterized protein n=1 Tax=Metamycoplasma cloacale TaxID=92401 RepID=A0A2Z4LMH6_9BACT|nr:hypothetical protein [Metamycoplasma cloacale]AWX42969.1 hypothetical protein DK849_02770 [Metamycoplasma cloacale]VEU79207.1 Uncharacterised protein [Metamycoplasma cloacale]
MNIKPIITGTNKVKSDGMQNSEINNMINYETMQTQALTSQSIKLKDPQGVIPNGIYKVFDLERKIKAFMLCIELIFILTATITALIIGFKPQWFQNEIEKAPWTWFILPILVGAVAIITFTFDLIDIIGVKRSVANYRESIKSGISTTPPFIGLLYQKLLLKQVRRTWLTVAILFYVGLFTIILWALQNQKWGELDWKTWIHKSFPNPNLVVYILCGIMGMVLLLFIINTIIRKKRMVDIQAFFGNDALDYNKMQEMKSKSHWTWAKVFFISILVILIIPFIIYILIKKLGRGGK